jgi:hypothetical protein
MKHSTPLIRPVRSIVKLAGNRNRIGSLVLAMATLIGVAEATAGGPSLLVTSQLDHTVKEYDGTTGVFIRNAARSIGDPLSAIIGADGNVLVTDGQQDVIKRFDRATGAYLGNFAAAVSPGGMTMFEGTVYVCQMNPPHVVRSFDAVTGADLGSFVPTVDLYPYPRDVKAANGRLYVAYWNVGTIEMFDLKTRQSLGLLFSPNAGGLVTPSSIAFGPDGNLYVSYGFYVNRYHPTTGVFLGRFVDTGDRNGYRYAVGIAWGPDGNLYVATQNTPGVQRYDGMTGAFMDDFVPADSGGLTAPFHISFTLFKTNNPPDCSNAYALVSKLWPPNQRLVPVEIAGVTDSDGDPVTITVTGVTQDEPLKTEADAVIANGSALVLAERSGKGNGRVYAVSFTASDDQGGSCDGSVVVCVPHDRGRDACVDDGQNFNSLGVGIYEPEIAPAGNAEPQDREP